MTLPPDLLDSLGLPRVRLNGGDRVRGTQGMARVDVAVSAQGHQPPRATVQIVALSPLARARQVGCAQRLASK